MSHVSSTKLLGEEGCGEGQYEFILFFTIHDADDLNSIPAVKVPCLKGEGKRNQCHSIAIS